MKSALRKKRTPQSEGHSPKGRRQVEMYLKTLLAEEDFFNTKYSLEALSRAPYRRIIE